jgi:phosphonate transport system substrate-binding protein
MKHRTPHAILVLLLLLSLLPAVPGSASAEPLQIGVAAMISPKDTFKYYKSMIEYVGKKVGRDVELVQRPTYDEMDGLLKNEAVQVAFICSGPYIHDKADFGAELLVAPVANGKPFYHAYIIAPKDSPADSLEALKGKSFAFTDPKSNTGYIVPSYMVYKQFGKKPEGFFSDVTFTKSHDKSIEAVAKKQVEGASIDSLIYDFAAKVDPTYTKLTKIISKSPAYGIPPIVVTKGIPGQLKEKIRKAFLGMDSDPAGRAILTKLNIDKFIVPDDKNYDTVREMEAELKKFNQ